jgi:hypothetical protein
VTPIVFVRPLHKEYIRDHVMLVSCVKLLYRTEEHRLRVFENRLLRIFGPKREEDGSCKNCIMMNFITCILHRILLG